MPLDLIGKLHRTIYIEGCPALFAEDLVRALSSKCGEVEAWDALENHAVGDDQQACRVVVVFKKFGDESHALVMNGDNYLNMGRLIIWKANETPPAATAQKSIAGPSSTGADAAAQEARRRRLEMLQASLDGPPTDSAAVVDRQRMTESERTFMLQKCAYRQLKALTVIYEYELKRMRESAAELRAQADRSREVLSQLTSREE